PKNHYGKEGENAHLQRSRSWRRCSRIASDESSVAPAEGGCAQSQNGRAKRANGREASANGRCRQSPSPGRWRTASQEKTRQTLTPSGHHYRPQFSCCCRGGGACLESV